MRLNVEALIASGITAYRVAKDAGIPNNTVVRLFSGESSIDNARFSLIERLSEYYEKVAETMETYEIDYGFNSIHEVKALDLSHAKRIAAENCSPEQGAIVIRKDGVDLSRSQWYGVAPDDNDKETAVAWWGGGFYGEWWDL